MTTQLWLPAIASTLKKSHVFHLPRSYHTLLPWPYFEGGVPLRMIGAPVSPTSYGSAFALSNMTPHIRP